MTTVVEPVVLGYRADPADDMDRLVLFLPEEWTMVFLRPYTPELLAQVRAENEIDDLDYVVAFNKGEDQDFWFYNCVESLGLGFDDDGDPFMQITFEADLAEEGIFDGTAFYVGFQEAAHTYTLFDQVMNVIDPDAQQPLPADLTHTAEVDPLVHPNVAVARERRRADGLT